MGNINSINGDAQPPTGDFKKFNDKELSRLKKVFDALYERFPYKTISFETLYKTFPLPEYLKEHLAHALDTSNAEIIDFAPMLDWLTLYCQGSMQLKMEILFRMYGLGQMIPVNQDDLEALLKALMTPISKFFTLSETSKVPSVGAKEAEYVNSMLKVIFEDHEINTDSEGKIRPEDYLNWQRENIHLVDMLERLLQNTRKKMCIFDYIRKNDKANVERWIAVSNNLNIQCRRTSFTPLIMASARKRPEIATKLVLAGADVNKSSRDGFTALHYSAQWDYWELTKLLIESGANLNSVGLLRRDRAGTRSLTPFQKTWYRNGGSTKSCFLLASAGCRMNPIFSRRMFANTREKFKEQVKKLAHNAITQIEVTASILVHFDFPDIVVEIIAEFILHRENMELLIEWTAEDYW